MFDCLLVHCALFQEPGRDMAQAPNLCSYQEALVSTSTWWMGETQQMIWPTLLASCAQKSTLCSVEMTVDAPHGVAGLDRGWGVIVASLTPDAPTVAAKRLGIHQA